jgi:hypothetical protein
MAGEQTGPSLWGGLSPSRPPKSGVCAVGEQLEVTLEGGSNRHPRSSFPAKFSILAKAVEMRIRYGFDA